MKIEVNTTEKIIKINEIVNLRELIDNLNSLFPNETWKEFSIDAKSEIAYVPYHNPKPYDNSPNIIWGTTGIKPNTNPSIIESDIIENQTKSVEDESRIIGHFVFDFKNETETFVPLQK